MADDNFLYFSTYETIGNSDLSLLNTWKGWDFDWPVLVLYKVENSLEESTNTVEYIVVSIFEKILADNADLKFNLHQNYPNPFNPQTTISFSIAEQSRVNLKIYDIIGREVITLVNDSLEPGPYNVDFNAGNLSSGIYFYRLSAGNYSETKKLQLIK